MTDDNLADAIAQAERESARADWHLAKSAVILRDACGALIQAVRAQSNPRQPDASFQAAGTLPKAAQGSGEHPSLA